MEMDAVFFCIIAALSYYGYRKIKLGLELTQPKQSAFEVDGTIKMKIEELHRLSEQHTNIANFLFDYEQQKEQTYTVSYTDSAGNRRTADIVKASDDNCYLRALSQEQLRKTELLMEKTVDDLSALLHENRNQNNALYAGHPKVSKTLQKVSKTLSQGTSAEGVESGEGECLND